MRRDPPRCLLGVAAILLLATCAVPSAAAAEGRDERPNILLLFADDLGVEGLTPYGGKAYRTPNLDRLAENGMTFELAYATPVCVASRVELLTGQYPFRNGWMGLTGPFDQKGGYVSPGLPSLACGLRDAGYATAAAGKWHLAPLPVRPRHPNQFGFDEYHLWKPGKRRYWKPWIMRDGEVREDLSEGAYGPDLHAEFVIDFIERNRNRPWFVYYPMLLVHEPLGRTPTGGTTDGDHVAYMDDIVGRLVAAIARLDLTGRTWVFFLADNGSPVIRSVQRGDRTIFGGKRDLSDRGAAVPFIVDGPGVPAGSRFDGVVDLSDVFPTIYGLAGLPLPSGPTFDGESLVRILRGQPGPRRQAAYVQFQDRFFVRDPGWRLHGDGRLYEMSERFDPKLVGEPASVEAREARRRLTEALRKIRPDVEIPIPSPVPVEESPSR